VFRYLLLNQDFRESSDFSSLGDLVWAALKSNGIFAHGGMVAQARCSIRHVGLGSRLPLPRFPLHGRVVGRTYCRKIFAVTLTQSLMFAGRRP
jgi:hypothetical protein